MPWVCCLPAQLHPATQPVSCRHLAAAAALLQEGGAVLVRVLAVPEACQPGDAVCLEGGQASDSYPKECKSKVRQLQ